MNVPIWAVWQDLIFIVYWPIWVVPLYLYIGRKHLKNKLVFLIGSLSFCFIIDYLISFYLSEIFFNSDNAEVDKFAFDNLEAISNIILILQVVIPMSVVYLSSKLKYFKMKSDSLIMQTKVDGR